MSVRALTYPRPDGSSIDVNVWDRGRGRPDRALLLIGGSSCRLTGQQNWFPAALKGAAPRWVVAVEKEGATPTGECRPEYEAVSTEEARWIDHLLALKQLRKDLGLRERGALDVMAISAGGGAGCVLAAATDDMRSLALLSVGGGRQFIEDVKELPDISPALKSQVGRLQSDPRLGQTWLGETNTEIWWWSALPKRCGAVLGAYEGGLLVVHGEADRSIPVVSARLMVAELGPKLGRRLHYIEMPGVGHDLQTRTDPEPAAGNGVTRALRWFAR